MERFRVIVNKKSIKYALILLCFLGIYYFYVSTLVDISRTENQVLLFEIFSSCIITLIYFQVPDKYKFYLNLVYVVILSLFTSITLDFLNGTYESDFEEVIRIILIRYFLSTLIALLIYLLLIAIIRNMKTACNIGCICFILIGIIGYIILEFRGNRLLFADLLALETALDVMGSYNIIPVKDPLLLGFVSMFCMIPTLFKIKSVKISYKSAKRLICYLIFAFGFFGLYHLDVDNYFYSWKEEENSYIFSFFANLKFIEIKPERNYQANKVIETINDADKSNILPVNFNPSEEIKDKFPDYVQKYKTTDPNIIVIMNESLADIDVFGETNTNKQIFTTLNSLPNTIKGKTYVDIRGGGTADSEYDFLTGNSTLILPLNARPYQFYVNSDSLNLVTYLNNLNYRTIAIHPGSPISWNRNVVYSEQFNFDEMIFDNQFINDTYVRDEGFKSDLSTYSKVLGKFSEVRANPYFIFDVTIQNHGGYKGGYENLNKVKLNEKYPEEVVEFLSLMKATDTQFAELIKNLQNFQEPTIVLIFGDHQPKFTVDFPSYSKNKNLSIEQVQSLYQTPYVIWANYSLPQVKPIDLSINYLSSLLLECAGIEKPPINNYLASLYNKIKVINRYGIITKDGKYYSYEDKIPEEYSDLIEEFRLFSYYNIVDQKAEDFDNEVLRE